MSTVQATPGRRSSGRQMLRRELPPSGDDETMAVRQPAPLTFTCRVVSCKPKLDLPGNLQLTRLGRFNSPDSLSAKELGFDSSHQPAEAPGGQATSRELLTSSPHKPRSTRPSSPATLGFRLALDPTTNHVISRFPRFGCGPCALRSKAPRQRPHISTLR